MRILRGRYARIGQAVSCFVASATLTGFHQHRVNKVPRLEIHQCSSSPPLFFWTQPPPGLRRLPHCACFTSPIHSGWPKPHPDLLIAHLWTCHVWKLALEDTLAPIKV